MERKIYGGKVVRPMLLHRGSTGDLDRRNYHAEQKWDGTRVYLIKRFHNIRLVVARGKHYDYTYKYPEIVSDAKKLRAISCVLDGELVWFDKRGQDVFFTIAVGPETVKSLKCKYMAFDILEYNGKDTRDMPIEARKQLLRKVIPAKLTIIKDTPIYRGDKKKTYRKVLARGGEGIVLKASKSLYQSGERTDTWVKVKKEKEVDCIVMGASPGTGTRLPYFGALHCYLPIKGKLTHIGDVGSGFNEDDLIEIKPMLNKPFVITVKYLEMSKDHHMRFPVFVRLRPDLNVKDVMSK